MRVTQCGGDVGYNAIKRRPKIKRETNCSSSQYPSRLKQRCFQKQHEKRLWWKLKRFNLLWRLNCQIGHMGRDVWKQHQLSHTTSVSGQQFLQIHKVSSPSSPQKGCRSAPWPQESRKTNLDPATAFTYSSCSPKYVIKKLCWQHLGVFTFCIHLFLNKINDFKAICRDNSLQLWPIILLCHWF